MSQTPTLEQLVEALEEGVETVAHLAAGQTLHGPHREHDQARLRDASTHLTWLKDSLADLFADAARLEWLSKHEAPDPKVYDGYSLREAIDAAKSPSVPSAPPLR